MKALLFLVLVSVTCIHAAAPVSWTSRGVGAGGGMFAPSFSPHDTNTAFLAVDMGHVLRTTIGGVSWTTIDYDQLEGKQFTEVQFTATPGVLYATDQRPRLPDAQHPLEWTLVRPVKSQDNGDTWLPLGSWPNSLRAISVHASPLRSDTIAICTGSDVRWYRNSGTGGSFSSAYTFNGSNGRVAGAFWNTGAQEECWLGTNQGLLYSTNGGQTFAASVALPTSDPMCSFAGGKDPATGQIRFYAVTTTAAVGAQSTPQGFSGGTSHVWRLDWGGSSWVDVTGPLTGGEHATIVAMSRGNADLAYVATFRPGSYPYSCAVWRVTSPGGAWQNIFSATGNGNIATGWLGLTQRSAPPVQRILENGLTYDKPCGLAVHPTQPSRVLFCDNAQITQSTNADATSPLWQQVYTTPDNASHGAGELIPNGQGYLGNGLEVTVCTQLDFCGGGVMQAAMLDVHMAVSVDGGKRWGWPFDHTTLGGGDVNSVAHDPVTGTRYAAGAFTNTAYEFLGCDEAHADMTGPPGSPTGGTPAGVYYQAPGETVWHALKTDFGVAAGQRGGNPVWLTFDANARRLYVSVASSDPAKDGIYVLEVDTGAWSKLPTPTRGGSAVLHPFTVSVLPDGAIVASFSAYQVGDAGVAIVTATNGAYKPTSGVFYLAPGAPAWADRTRNEMRYFTRDVVVDPHDTSGQTWFACVWNTDSNVVTPTAAGDTPAGWGGLYRTTDAGVNWTRIWNGDANFSGSATSCTLHPESAMKDELLLTTRYGGLWITQNAHAASPSFLRVDSYRFRAPERAYYDPTDHDKIWVTSNGNGIVEGVRPTTFGEWRVRNFGNSSAADAVSGPLADPDSDGKINAIEYATQGDATMPDLALLSLRMSPTLNLSFHRRRAASDATFTIEGSPDLLTWQPLAQAVGMGAWNSVTGFVVSEAEDGSVAAIDSTSASHYFYRLQIYVP